MSYVLQYDDGQIATAHSISAGLDYPGVGPEHAYYRDLGRFEFVSVTDEEALEGFQTLARLEGIMPALESAHAVAHALRLAKQLPRTKTIVVGLSGRGDKDVQVVAKALARSRMSRLDDDVRRAARPRASARSWRSSRPATPRSTTTARLVIEAERRGADVIELACRSRIPSATARSSSAPAQRALAAGASPPRPRAGAHAARARCGCRSC